MNRITRASTLALGLALTGCGDGAPPTGEPLQEFAACEGTFTLTQPNPAYIWTPNAITLVSEELAPGVFAVYDQSAADHGPAGIPLATSGGFVIGEDGVLMVESMINRQLFCQLVGLVRAQTDKPILYVVNTSSHGDHSFGNAFLPSEVHVVQHERTAAYIDEHFEDDVAFMTANFGTDQGLDELHAVAADTLVSDAGWSVDLGGVTVEARYFGFGQTVGDLFVHVPSAAVLWAGNPVIGEAPAIPWLLDGHAEEVSATLDSVRAFLPADAVIVPGHGRPIRPDDMGFSIDYLRALVAEVAGAVEQGRSLEETVASVTLEAFQGYAIWDWVHAQVNVPKTYAELGP